MIITVMGATGQTGHVICTRLLHAGATVRALGRSEEKLAPLAALGAEPWVGAPDDAAFLARPFAGADAAYLLLPYGLDVDDYLARQREQSEAMVEAIRASRLPRAVALSSVGAELASGNGPIRSLHSHEARLRGIEGLDLLILRAGAFFENFVPALGVIREHGMVADAMAPDVDLPMIASRDIAEAAAQALLATDWHGQRVRELLGQRDLSYAEATRIIGARIGQPELPYVQMPQEEMAGILAGAGFSASLAALYVELAQAISDGRIRSLEGRDASNSTPTAFEAFADELAALYRSA
ncbi:NmrA family NAD(P)-binding protein [Pseudomonas sp. PDM13]|uniref:NmrA family NAD(P)-binding protein n=1 Tax=Pseudomonas sp. PDM13 TaxID=2769255 RepID=UPI0021E0264A|nr:NmrA family NAD(P)-binding protein [Pseudomonas sp. PDM13]MCU9949504.1 NAD(P)H-binding protein [Pseudomonas sp. PDM13]